MNVVWSYDEALTVRNVHTILAFRGIAYTTVMTTMDRLAEKGLLKRGERRMGNGGAYYYTSAISRGELLAGAVELLCEQLEADHGDRAFALAALMGRPR
jgi:predicted transcriptional regulator